MKKYVRRPLIAVDLFSGCGGLTLGLKQVKFRVAGAIDIDPVAMETYKTNHPEVKTWLGDIRQVSAGEVRKELKLKKGELDLLAGCPPCQGFSTIRTFNGGRKIKDERNDLVFDFLRFVKEFMPKSIMMENVPALAKDKRIQVFQNEIEALGYESNCNVLDAADYAVPQRRRRMILLAGKDAAIHYAPATARTMTVRKTISSLSTPGKSGDPLHDYPEKRSEGVMKIIKMIPKDGGSRRKLGPEWQLACHVRCAGGFKDVYGRMKWDDLSPTVTSGCTNPSKGRFLHPEQNRAITLREAALLQSFPPNYYFSLSGGKQGAALMIGNALPPNFIRHHAQSVVEYLKSYA